MKSFTVAAAAALLSLGSSLAFGSGSGMAGRVGFVHVMSSGLIYVDVKDITRARTNVPACSMYPVRLVFDGTTPGGQAMFKALMAAHATQAQIWLAGTGTCQAGGYEIVDYIGLYPNPYF